MNPRGLPKGKAMIGVADLIDNFRPEATKNTTDSEGAVAFASWPRCNNIYWGKDKRATGLAFWRGYHPACRRNSVTARESK